MHRSLLTFAVLILLVYSSFAQTIEKTGGHARLLGMGSNPYIVDPYYITYNPAWGEYYDNFIFGDLGFSSGNFTRGGINQFIAADFRLSNNITIGGILARNDAYGFSISYLDPGDIVTQINNLVGPNSVVPLNNNFELLGTYHFYFGTVGLAVAYATTTNEANPATGGSTTGSASQFGVNAGIIMDLTGRLRLDAAGMLVFPSASYQPQTGQKSEISQTIIGLAAHAFFKYSSKVTFVPSAFFVNSSGTLNNAGTSGDLTSMSGFGFGIGINYTVGDFLLAGGPAFSTFSTTIPSTATTAELKNSVFSFPVWNFGVEWNMLDWLVARFGYISLTNKATTQTPVAGSPGQVNEFVMTNFTGQNGATLGLGFKFGSFTLDATINEDVLRQGLNNIGGGGPTFAFMSLSYAMP